MNFRQKLSQFEEKFLDVCEQVVREQDLELYALEYILGSKTLKVFINQKDSLTADINDCIKVDRALSPFFETNEWIPEDVTLEVSSPGVFRKISCDKHLEQSVGERVALQALEKLEDLISPKELEELGESFFKKNKNEKKFVGKLESFTNDKEDSFIKFYITEKQAVKIDTKNIKRINVEPNIF